MKCSYCHSNLAKTHGKMFVKESGEIFYFCSGKCEKNWQKNRKLAYVSKKKTKKKD
jgi:large subunit ribosomal protein L24e